MGAEAQREGQDELRHHPLRLRRNETAQPKKAAASGEHPGFVRCLSGRCPVRRSVLVRSLTDQVRRQENCQSW